MMEFELLRSFVAVAECGGFPLTPLRKLRFWIS